MEEKDHTPWLTSFAKVFYYGGGIALGVAVIALGFIVNPALGIFFLYLGAVAASALSS
jgi:hypothetical protein